MNEISIERLSKFYVGRRWVEPLQGRQHALVDPATQDTYGVVALGCAEDVNRAVVAAREAFAAFSRTPRAGRVALLERIAAGLERRLDDVMAAITKEMGAPVSLRAQAAAGLDSFRQAAITLREYEFEEAVGSDLVVREPIGVCGLITAWNWPIQILSTKLASALAAGCAVIVKPSEFSPLSSMILAEVLHDAGVPAGVFNLVNGDGPEAGQAICAHPDIDMVSFTGSTRAGIQVARAAADTVKRVCQELGGKSANIILDDADLETAARWNVQRAFSNTGQSCHAPSRVLVQKRQLGKVIDWLADEARNICIGDPRHAATTMGPVVNGAQFERIQEFIRSGLKDGARIVCGGLGRPDGLERGYFVRPTIFADVVPAMRIAREEIFGPVLCLMSYDSVDDAVSIANDTPYGLGGYVFTSDPIRAREVGARIRAGRVFCNGKAPTAAIPMGGYKQSGNGREYGVWGLEEFLEVKALIGFEPVAG